MSTLDFPTLTAAEITATRPVAVDDATLRAAGAIVDDVRARGEAALRAHGERLGDIAPGAPLVRTKDELAAAAARLSSEDRAVLTRVAERIERFARAQRAAIEAMEMPIPGGRAGHEVVPMERAGCYAPGGRFPLPSSVLMTVVTARAAGVKSVWVASPNPTDATLAAAHIAGADALLQVGGAQAIAAFAYGAGPVPAVDIIVGPGNRWVTAAKKLVSGQVAIDMLAGPSELVVLADADADPELIAADLLGQAEHDPDARALLVTDAPALPEAVRAALARQLEDLPTAAIARASLNAHGAAILCADRDEARQVCDALAPEHLEILTATADEDAKHLNHFGGLFIGAASAEVFGDYGAGPNHVLPTGGTARVTGGLSVFNFLRIRTWLRMESGPNAEGIIDDAVALARMEGLEAHARSAEKRRL